MFLKARRITLSPSLPCPVSFIALMQPPVLGLCSHGVTCVGVTTAGLCKDLLMTEAAKHFLFVLVDFEGDLTNDSVN